MVFIIQKECPCCKDMLWHCEKCWNRFHQGKKDNDYIPPKYYGQSMMREEMQETMGRVLGIEHDPSIKPDKNRKYKEGEYH